MSHYAPPISTSIEPFHVVRDDESLKAYLAPTGLVSKPRSALTTCRGGEGPLGLGGCAASACLASRGVSHVGVVLLFNNNYILVPVHLPDHWTLVVDSVL